MFNKLKIYLKPFANWKFCICFLIPYMINNGWSWIGVALIPITGMTWFSKISIAWQTFLWQPFVPEKLIIIPISLWLHSKLFKNDEKTKQSLNAMYNEAKKDWCNVKFKMRYPYLKVTR